MTPYERETDPSVLQAHLQESLGESYSIERELGGGGMSRVFVARERALHRLVVVKVLPFDLAALNSDRFRREIQLVAGMQHPHIVPVLSTGDAGGAPYFTMPYIEGESLSKRLEKGMLPVGETLSILYDVIDALAYAHERGIVHRDIKPDNILMSGDHAVVTDFGVAKALGAATDRAIGGDTNVTAPSMAVGTPAYMAPEQAAGDPDTDHRADIYAWGLLAYEMLAGQPVFGTRSSHEMLVAHIAEVPQELHARNSLVPEGLSDLVMRCLEKRPSDRPGSAQEVRAVLGQPATPIGGTPIARSMHKRRALLRLALSLATVVVVLAGAFAFRPRARILDESRVAVLPFRLSSADPSLRYLREGMLDLLAAKLTGEGGPRSVDPRTILGAVRRAAGSDSADLPRAQALDLAERIGAGQLLIGEVTGTAQRLTITASLFRVRDGRSDAPRSVSGPADSIPGLVDRLASELLALRAGEGERLGAFSGVSLAALQAYLDGSSLYRRARFGAAARQFDRAIGYDSSFALAGLGLATAAGWVGDPSDRRRGLAIAWQYRSHLGARDRALLVATAGPDFPSASGSAALIAAKQRYAALAPDRADAQFELGDALFHFGASAGLPDAHVRAADAFNRTIALDSSFSPALEHLIVLEMERGDSVTVAHLGRLYLAADSTSENRDGVRWAMAVARGDSTTARGIVRRGDSLSGMAAATIQEVPRLIGRSIDAMQMLADRATPADASPMRRAMEFIQRHDLALDGGQPTLARLLLDSLHSLQLPSGGDEFERVRDALFWDGDTTGVGAATQLMERRALLGRPTTGGTTRSGDAHYYNDMCIPEFWALSHGDTSGVLHVASVMLDHLDPHDTLSNPSYRLGCALALRAQLAVMRQHRDAHAAIDSLDGFLRDAPSGSMQFIGNMVASRLYERIGDTRAALLAVRRRDFFYGRSWFYSTLLRDEARLAEKAGDTAGAVEALRKYVALRRAPEPAFANDRAEARAALVRVGRYGAGR